MLSPAIVTWSVLEKCTTMSKPSPTNNKLNVTQAINTQSRILMVVIRSADRAQIEKSTRVDFYTDRAFPAQAGIFRERGNSSIF
jgi:hypothetical protein